MEPSLRNTVRMNENRIREGRLSESSTARRRRKTSSTRIANKRLRRDGISQASGLSGNESDYD